MNIKRKGLLLLDAAISAIILGIAAMSFVMLYSSQFALLSAGQDGKTAMQYAEVDAEILKTLSYQDIKDDDILGEALLHQNRGQILSVPDANGWQDEIIYGDEHHIASNDSDYTVATVNIYKDGDSLPRATLKVPLSSETNGKGEAVGSIVARLSTEFATQGEKDKYLFWDGSSFDTSKYPKLYKVLGSNKLPNLQGMFLRGYGSQAYDGKILSSGETGNIQNWGSPRVILDNQIYASYNIHGQSFNDFKYVGGPTHFGNWLDGSSLGHTVTGHNAIYTYKYTINSMSPCGIAAINEEIENEINITPIWAERVQYDSTWKVPDANEVRPVNVAVRYYIKAK